MLLFYSKPIRTFLSLLLTALLISACGGGGGDTPAPNPVTSRVAAGQKASATMQAQGVTVTLTTTEGAVFTLVVPSGALPEGTNVSISTEQPTANNRFSLRLSPADTVLTNGLKARLLITMPEALRTLPNAVIVYDRVPLAYNVGSAGQIEFEFSRFAAQPLSPISALMESILATTPSPRGCTLPTVSSYQEGTLADTALTSIEAYGTCMVDAVNALAASGKYEDAARAASATAAMLQMAGSQNTALILGFIDSASRIACAAQRAVLDAAQATNVTTQETLYPLIKPVYFWQTVIHQLGAQCSQIAPNELETVVNAKINQAIAYYTSQKPQIINTSSGNYTAAVAEARASQQTLQEVKSLQPPASVQQNMTQEIEQRAQPALLDSMLQAPWQRCRDTGNYDKLIEMMGIMNNAQSIKTAAQYCATQLDAQAKDASNSVTAVLSPSLGGVKANEQRGGGSIVVQKDGKLLISGPINKLQCPAGSAGGSESLLIKFNGTTVSTQTGAPYLANALELSITSLLQAANILPENFTGGSLTLERSGSPCEGFWGEHPVPLLKLTLSTGACKPQAGHVFCYTPIEIAGSFESVQPLALTDAGALFGITKSAGCVSSSCGGTWKNGVFRDLPNRFLPTDMANDGTVVGMEMTTDLDPYLGLGVYLSHPAVVPSSSQQFIRLANSLPVDSSLGGQSFVKHYFDTPIISPSGRVTYTEFEYALVPTSVDLGYCKQVTYPNGVTRNVCDRRKWHRAIGPNWSASNVLHTETISAQTLNDWEWWGDSTSIGLYGRVCVTAGCFTAKAFSALAEEGTIVQADELGNTIVHISSTIGAGRYLRSAAGANVTVPPNWSVGRLGSQGHVLLYINGASSNEIRLLHIPTQTLGNAWSIGNLMIGGDAFALIENNGPVDSKGRVLLRAESTARPNTRAMILTPQGVALP